MTFALRDTQPTVVYLDTDLIRAGLGEGELFNRPTMNLRASYAVPFAGPSTRLMTTNGAESGETNGDPANGEDVEGKGGWLVGEAVEKAQLEPGWEEKLEVRWPFRQTKALDDWDGREFILSHLLSLLNIRISTNTSPLLLVLPPSPPSLSLPTQALYTQLAFERLNVPAFSILPSPLAAIFALGTTTGIVLHVTRETSEVSIIVDSVVRWDCCVTVQVGHGDCLSWFEGLLLADAGLDRELKQVAGVETWEEGRKERLVKELVEVVWRECTGDDTEIPNAKTGSNTLVVANSVPQEDEGTFDVAKKLVGDAVPVQAAASHKSKKQQTAAAVKAASDAAAAQAAADAANQADLITLTIPSLSEKEIALGPLRHRLLEPLLRGRESGGESVWEGMGRAVESPSLSYTERLAIWEGVGVVGEAARIKSFAPALMTYLAPFLLSSPDLPSDTQPATVRLLSIPAYFANFKNATSELAPFLGGSMVAKVAFSDAIGKQCVTKVDYNAKGPAAIYAVGSGDDR